MHVSFFEYPISNDENIQIALISFERQRSYKDVGSILYDDYKAKLQSVDIIILRPAVDMQVSSLEEEINKAEDVIKRFPHLPILLLTSANYNIALSDNINRSVNFKNNEGSEKFIDFLQQKELEEFVLRSLAILRSPPNTAFKTPSQEFTHTFLRVGNIQTHKHVLDSIFFWTIPYLNNVGGILTDSWTISSIALNISRFICRYDSSINIADFHVNMLTTHFNGQKTLDKETEHNLFNLTYKNEKRILFLISAIKTLKSLNNIQSILSSLSIHPSLNYLAIYKLINNNKIDCLCDLGEEFQRSKSLKFDTFDTVPEGEEVIEIDEKIFFPIQAVETELSINKTIVDSISKFFRDYEGKEVIYIHRDSYYINKEFFRHHGIYIDVTKMLLCDTFIEKLRIQVDEIKKLPSLIIYPPHEHGHNLVNKINELLQNKYGKEVDVFQILDLNFLEQTKHEELKKKLELLKDDDLILIVDDVSVSGSRLKNYQKKLRDVYKGQIQYFIGVARPDNEVKWLQTERDLKFRGRQINGFSLEKHIVTCIDTVILPDWNLETCPWCNEKNMLHGITSKPHHRVYPVNQSLLRRHNNLETSKDRGLLNDVYLSINDKPKPTFQGSSIFAEKKEISEADLTAIVACTLQHLRNHGVETKDKPIKLGHDYPHYKIIKITDYLTQSCAFNEALIKAAIFRTAYPTEIHASTHANQLLQEQCVIDFWMNKGIRTEELSLFKYELYLALKGKKLPKLRIEEKNFSTYL